MRAGGKIAQTLHVDLKGFCSDRPGDLDGDTKLPAMVCGAYG